MKAIKDNFSENACNYSKFRPHYPDDLYNFIYSRLENFEAAWDCGTGNGQVAVELSKQFRNVFATDISRAQLDESPLRSNVNYIESRAEETNFQENSFDLITVAQAAHWFDLPAFYKEVLRVAKPKAIIAIWGYNLLKINSETDKVINYFYKEVVGSFWDGERRMVDESYANIPFPFHEITTPQFEINTHWNYEQLIGYINSWSAVLKYKKNIGQNPIQLIEKDLLEAWGKHEINLVKFPIFMRFGNIN